MFTEKIFETHFLMEREENQEEDKERDAVPQQLDELKYNINNRQLS